MDNNSLVQLAIEFIIMAINDNMVSNTTVQMARLLRDKYGIDHVGVLSIAGALPGSDLHKVAEVARMSMNMDGIS